MTPISTQNCTFYCLQLIHLINPVLYLFPIWTYGLPVQPEAFTELLNHSLSLLSQ